MTRDQVTFKNIKELIEELDNELMRSKDDFNSSGYSRYSAYGQIVTEYRTKLKKLRADAHDDLFDLSVEIELK